MSFQDQPSTLSEYETLVVEHPDRRFELVHGEVVERFPTQLSGYVTAVLCAAMVEYVRENPIGVALARATYNLPDDDHNARIPDLSFIALDKGPIVEVGPAPYMPDLAVEVQSPGQSDRLMLSKADDYLDNGTRMVWLIYADRRLVEVITADERHLLTVEHTLDGGDVLPGFSIAVSELFPQ